mmetsp:Transcript_2898/g.4430  ORF Transcript_2898/g.4430 Transcript_2898/m.4430 type:complete len:175 (+) Transcript_2898:459-983(+)
MTSVSWESFFATSSSKSISPLNPSITPANMCPSPIENTSLSCGLVSLETEEPILDATRFLVPLALMCLWWLAGEDRLEEVDDGCGITNCSGLFFLIVVADVGLISCSTAAVLSAVLAFNSSGGRGGEEGGGEEEEQLPQFRASGYYRIEPHTNNNRRRTNYTTTTSSSSSNCFF